MEVGRSSITGEGELWMEVEDTVIAQNMHEVILRYTYLCDKEGFHADIIILLNLHLHLKQSVPIS